MRLILQLQVYLLKQICHVHPFLCHTMLGFESSHMKINVKTYVKIGQIKVNLACALASFANMLPNKTHFARSGHI